MNEFSNVLKILDGLGIHEPKENDHMDGTQKQCAEFCNSFRYCSDCPVSTGGGVCVVHTIANMDESFENVIAKVFEHNKKPKPKKYSDVFFEEVPNAPFELFQKYGKTPKVCRRRYFNQAHDLCAKYGNCGACWAEIMDGGEKTE